MAFCPMGVAADGVMAADGVTGVMPPGVAPTGVAPAGVAPAGVAPPGVALGVSSHLDLLLEADPAGVDSILSTPPLSVRGVSAHPAPWPGVSRSVRGVSSHL